MNRDLFIVDFDLDALANARTRSDLQAMGGCFYNDESVLGVRWHDDETKIAMRFAGTSPSGSRADLIRIVDISNCQSGFIDRLIKKLYEVFIFQPQMNFIAAHLFNDAFKYLFPVYRF